MSLDLDAIAPAQRAAYIRTGRNYGSELVLAQADDFVKPIEDYLAELSRRGFGLIDFDRLKAGILKQLELGTQRTLASNDVRAATHAYDAALKTGKQARRDADPILRGARTDLADAGDAESVKAIDIALAKVKSTSADSTELRAQLDVLRNTLTLPAVAAKTAARGGTVVVAANAAALTVLREAEQRRPGKPGTPEHTEMLDLVDGILIDLLRRARRAARAAATALGQPIIAKRMELTVLNGRSTRAKDDGGDPNKGG